jgi:hypothetical protein
VQLKEENYCIKCNAMHCNAVAGGKKKKTKLTSMNKKMHSGCSSSDNKRCSGLVDTRAISTATKGFVTRGVLSQEEEEEEDEEETQITSSSSSFPPESQSKQSPGLKLSLER